MPMNDKSINTGDYQQLQLRSRIIGASILGEV